MPHQCLKCGAVFPDGSPQILRGCPDCGGAKFFFTNASISDEERNKLKEKANKDIKNLIHEMLVNDSIPIKIKEKSVKKDEWVYLGKVEKDEKGALDGKKQEEMEKKIIKSIEDLKFPQEGRFKRLKFSQKSGDAKPSKAPKKAEVDKTAKASPEAAPKKKTAKKADKKEKKKESVAVITITDEGVYELDVEKLMEHSPIIVQKDGTYMVHLPSVFKAKDDEFENL